MFVDRLCPTLQPGSKNGGKLRKMRLRASKSVHPNPPPSGSFWGPFWGPREPTSFPWPPKHARPRRNPRRAAKGAPIQACGGSGTARKIRLRMAFGRWPRRCSTNPVSGIPTRSNARSRMPIAIASGGSTIAAHTGTNASAWHNGGRIISTGCASARRSCDPISGRRRSRRSRAVHVRLPRA